VHFPAQAYRLANKHAFAAACAALAAATAFGQVGIADGPPRSAAEELAAAKSHAKALAERAALAAIDTTPPVLKNFSLSGSVNAQLPNPSVDASIKLTDNLSGVVYYYVQLQSPSGAQTVYRTKNPPAPSTNISSTLTVGSYPLSYGFFGPFSEPGIWRATTLYAYDANGNGIGYSQTDLAALGNIAVNVVNSGGYDVIAPTFESGTLLTTTVKLSKPPVGTDPGTLPYVSADLNMTDAGNGAISGTYFGQLTLCRSDGAGGCSDYLQLFGVTNRSGLSANTLRVGTQLRADQTTGSYKMYSVTVRDIAGNSSIRYSTAFGGDIDFRDYFPVTTIFVNP
jgi:hypothetical protein